MIKVLVVDDNKESAALYCDVLELENFVAQAELNGAAAIERCRLWSPDAIVIDIELPDMSGIELARQLKEQLGYGGTIVGTSGYDPEKANSLGADRYFDHFIQKPIDVDRLIELLDGAAAAPGPA
ncbi:MAG: response regulator [Gammaproteobacteria bacterium]|nr:response regulator [Gammaproteobacteria bacterium]